MSPKNNLIIFAALFLFTISSCKKDDTPSFDSKNYPEEIGAIMLNKCATAGCHNDISAAGAAGLSLTNWDKLFEGSRGGSPVIPYRADQSFMMFFLNTDPNQGIVLEPTMPFNASPLSQEEYASVQNWITNGAPDKDGKVKFSDDPNRRKFYVTNQGCDMVSVFDAETKTLMRYIDVGSSSDIESPHQVKVSPDGKYWYTIFFAGSTIQKYDAIDDSFVSEAEIGEGSWNTFRISPDGKTAYAIDWAPSGSIAIVDLENMQLKEKYEGSGLLELPHGSMINQANNTLYVTAQHGNFIYKIDISNIENPNIEKVSLNDNSPTTISWLNPHEIEMTPDESKYFVTCEESNEVRIMNTAADTLLGIIPTGEFPQEMSLSITNPYLFVTCTEDLTTFPGKIGSIHVIDYTNNTLIKTIYTGYQPHGIAVDDVQNLVYVSHRNINSNGPAPHHSTDCDGRNGYVTIIDMNTLELVEDYKVEVSVDPYSVAIRN